MPDAAHSYTPTGRTSVFFIPAYDDNADLRILFSQFADTASSIGGDVYTGVHNFTGGLQKSGVDVVTLTGTQTLTAKTLTSPTVTGATITGGTLSNTDVDALTLKRGNVDAVLISGAQTITGKTIQSPKESVTLTSTAASGTIDLNAATNATTFYTGNATANFTLNLRGTPGSTLNTYMATGEAMTIVFLAAQGTTAYFCNTVKIDGTTITPKFQYGSAFAAGNVSGIDSYVFDVFKTANATFTVFASMTKYA